MVETQAIGVCVILPCILLVVDLRELKCCKSNIKIVVYLIYFQGMLKISASNMTDLIVFTLSRP